MALTIGAKGPANGPDLVAVKVASLFGRRVGLGTEWALDQVGATAGHRSFRCDLAGAAEDVLGRAVFTGWRYIVLRGGVARIEATVGSRGDQGSRVTAAALSPALAAELADLDWLSAAPEVKAGDFEVCYLRVPAGIVRAWWLISNTGDRGQDLLLPVSPSHRELRAGQPAILPAGPFRSKVAALAARKLEERRVLVRGVPGAAG